MINLKTKFLLLIFYGCFSSPVDSAAVISKLAQSEFETASQGELRSENMAVKLEKVVDGLGIPWGLSFLSANQLLVTERGGAVKLLDIDKGRVNRLNNVPDVMVKGQGGMLDVAVSPDYNLDGWIYFSYVKSVKGLGVTVLSRAKLLDDRFTHWQQLLITKSATKKSFHFGSRITFDERGHVYFSVGDRGIRKNSQDLSNHAGSIIRLNLDGSIPTDNPFSDNKKLLPEVWSYGHRNPQGLVYDVKNQRLWAIEHGPRGGDEINLIQPGANYGWPVISYGKEYWGPIDIGEGTHREGMEQPLKVYIPSIAPGSLLLYSADALPGWNGNLFSGALKIPHINRIVLSEQGKVIQEERLLEDLDERIRALAQSPEGWLYFSTDSGNIYRLRPTDK